MFDKARTYQQPRLCDLVLSTLLLLPVTVMTRKERESILDKISGNSIARTEEVEPRNDDSKTPGVDKDLVDSTSVLLKELSIMIRLMGQRNPTSQLVRSGIVLMMQ